MEAKTMTGSSSPPADILAEAIRLSGAQDWVALSHLVRGHPVLVDALDDFGQVLLARVIYSAPLEVLDHLVASGADLNHLDSEGVGLLHALVVQDSPNLERLRWALSRGAAADGRSGLGWTPMHFVAERGTGDAASLLVEFGADVNARTLQDGSAKTPLMVAARAGNVDVIGFLLEHGADPDLKDKRHRTAYDYARFVSGRRVKDVLRRWRQT
jgi:ankyrin repeat protein